VGGGVGVPELLLVQKMAVSLTVVMQTVTLA